MNLVMLLMIQHASPLPYFIDSFLKDEINLNPEKWRNSEEEVNKIKSEFISYCKNETFRSASNDNEC